MLVRDVEESRHKRRGQGRGREDLVQVLRFRRDGVREEDAQRADAPEPRGTHGVAAVLRAEFVVEGFCQRRQHGRGYVSRGVEAEEGR